MEYDKNYEYQIIYSMMNVTLDRNMLENFYGDDPEVVLEILDQYAENEAEMRSSMQSAFNAGRKELIAKVHYYSSIYSYVGFPGLSKDCVAFENEFKENPDEQYLALAFDHLFKKICYSIEVVKQEIAVLKGQNLVQTKIAS